MSAEPQRRIGSFWPILAVSAAALIFEFDHDLQDLEMRGNCGARSGVEEQVLHFIKQNNRPYNTQLVADHLAQYGLKKGPIQKALDALSEAQKISCKEFGKTKIYCAVQDSSLQLSKEEIDAKTAIIAKLNTDVSTTEETVRELRKVLKDVQSTMTIQELDRCNNDLQVKADAQGSKLVNLRSGSVLIPEKDRATVEKGFLDAMHHWSKRKRVFKNIWESVSENVDRKQADLFEEIGVDTDEMIDVDYKSFERLLPKKGRF